MRKKITEAIKECYSNPNTTRLNFEDLYTYLDLDFQKGFKMPKFNTFNGDGNFLFHFRAYYDQLIRVEKNEAILMQHFSQSLSGEYLDWFTSQEIEQWLNWNALVSDFIERFAYNIEIIHDQYSLEIIK